MKQNCIVKVFGNIKYPMCSNFFREDFYKISNFFEYNKKRKKLVIKGTNQFVKSKELGLPLPIVSEETRKKISEASKKRVWTEEQRKKHSESMKMAVKNHPDSYTKNNVVGRVKNLEYNGVKLKGKWELIVAQWLDENKIKWEHETKSFEYKWRKTMHSTCLSNKTISKKYSKYHNSKYS